ncbi:MAG: DUF5104 domain-containing protein [Firmicutes bacterium]|nr:DUF5104 domain-containing protein [Bacillota bacterium]
MTFSDDKKVDAHFGQLTDAIKNKDKDAIKTIFSKQALEEAESIDESIEYLLTLIQGEIKSWKNENWGSDGVVENGKTVLTEIKSWYKVTTEKDEYLFFLLDYTKDIKNPDNVGLYTLRAIKEEDRETHFTYWQDMKIAGIYMPKE